MCSRAVARLFLLDPFYPPHLHYRCLFLSGRNITVECHNHNSSLARSLALPLARSRSGTLEERVGWLGHASCVKGEIAARLLTAAEIIPGSKDSAAVLLRLNFRSSSHLSPKIRSTLYLKSHDN